jgi:Arc/MetJ family transcription regulator
VTSCATDDVYGMRMARVNITIPDDLLASARAADLNVSRLAASALSEELDRRAKITALDIYLAELEEELGPTSEADRVAAQQWADRLRGDPAGHRNGTETR